MKVDLEFLRVTYILHTDKNKNYISACGFSFMVNYLIVETGRFCSYVVLPFVTSVQANELKTLIFTFIKQSFWEKNSLCVRQKSGIQRFMKVLTTAITGPSHESHSHTWLSKIHIDIILTSKLRSSKLSHFIVVLIWNSVAFSTVMHIACPSNLILLDLPQNWILTSTM
jgi:uncharacterized membrane protein